MKMRLAVANVEPLENDNTQDLEAHRISGKTAGQHKKDNEDGLMSKDDFHPVTD
jgi:hypothetical protein